MTHPAGERRPGRIALVFAASLIVLGALASLHPGLRFVDMIPFSVRAQALLRGERLVDGLYPIGYPALLAAARLLVGDVLLAGKLLSVLAGAGLVAGVARWLGGPAALWFAAQTGLLLWGATEGTDLLAAAGMIAAVALAPRSGPAAVALGLACLTRYTAVAALPVVLLLTPRRGRFLLVLVAVTAPHWAVALLTGASPLPAQDLNASIGAGHASTLWSLETLGRWPIGVLRAAASAFVDLATWLGLLGLAVGGWRRDRRALGLLGLALGVWLLIGLGFANPRLVLPATLAIAIGAAWLPGRWTLPVAAAVAGALAWTPATTADPSAELADVAVTATETLDGPSLSNSPWFHQHRDGWLVPSVQLTTLVRDPGGLTPAALATICAEQGFRFVALDLVRTRRSFPGLSPLLGGEPPPGWTVIDRPKGWRIVRPAD